MANKRLFRELLGVVANGLSVGGNTAIDVDESYVNSTASQGDGMVGPSDEEDSGQQTKFTMATQDIEQGIPLLISTPGSMVFYGKESGTATYGKGMLINPVFNSLRFATQLSGYAAITLSGQCRYPTPGSTHADVFTYDNAQTKPTIRHPLRQRKLGDGTHVNGGSSLVIRHMLDVSFNLVAGLLVAYDGNDVGTTDVEVGEYGVPTVSITFEDKAKHATETKDIATQVMENGVGDFTVPLFGVGDTPDRVLTLRNVKFKSKSSSRGESFTRTTLTGSLNFRDPLTPWTIRTIDDATAADRLINLA